MKRTKTNKNISNCCFSKHCLLLVNHRSSHPEVLVKIQCYSLLFNKVAGWRLALYNTSGSLLLKPCEQCLLQVFSAHDTFFIHCVKCVQIRSYFWSVFFCVRTEYRKIRTRNNSVFGLISRSDKFDQMIKNSALFLFCFR